MLKRLLRRERTRAVLASLLARYLAFALATTRWSVEGMENVEPHIEGEPAIVAFWHERLPLMPALWTLARRHSGTRTRPIRVLISRHADGRFIGAAIRVFGMDVIHASSSRGGAAGLRALVDSLASGVHVGITPDGPRGPRRCAAPGVARLAALSGAPILPCSAQTSRRRVLKSWDRMVLPLPWGRGVLVCRPVLRVPREAGDAALAGIAASLTEAADAADRLLEHA
jgi:lysophospholipid acyltransferase (LPLAT)-like uncharacterized protein